MNSKGKHNINGCFVMLYFLLSLAIKCWFSILIIRRKIFLKNTRWNCSKGDWYS